MWVVIGNCGGDLVPWSVGYATEDEARNAVAIRRMLNADEGIRPSEECIVWEVELAESSGPRLAIDNEEA